MSLYVFFFPVELFTLDNFFLLDIFLNTEWDILSIPNSKVNILLT